MKLGVPSVLPEGMPRWTMVDMVEPAGSATQRGNEPKGCDEGGIFEAKTVSEIRLKS